jgi:hypothetical protein
MSGVEFVYMGKPNQNKQALKIESLIYNPAHFDSDFDPSGWLINSVIRDSEGDAINMKSSNHFDIDNNVIYGMCNVQILMDWVEDSTISNNVIMKALGPETESGNVDPVAFIWHMGSFDLDNDNLHVHGNIG